MIAYTVESSGHEVLFATSFLAYDDGPCVLKFTHSGVDFAVNMSFKSDEEKKEPRVDYTTNGPHFNLVFVNFTSQFGNGNVDPWQPGTLDNRPISFRFHVTQPFPGTKTRRVELAMYLQKEVQQ